MSLNTKIRGLQIKDADISATQLGTDAVETLKIKDNNVTLAKLEDAPSGGEIIICSGEGGYPAYKLVTGDININDEGVTSIVNDVIVNSDIKTDAAIAYSKLNLTGAILNADLAGSIAFAKLADVLDEDDMASDSDVKLATQQSIKKYVDDKTTIDTFVELTDTPANFDGAGLKGVRVNSGATALEFYSIVDTDEKVKADAGASAEYLDAIVDDSSIEITAGDNLAVKALGITNAMLAGSIVYSKLSLTGEILNADLAGSIADDKLVEDYVKENQIQKVTFAGDGSTVIFDVGDTPIANSVQVFLNGLLQEEGSGKDYTLTDDDITFATAPVGGGTPDFIQIHSVKA